MSRKKFESRFPSHQNALDIFVDTWAGQIETVYPGLTSGKVPLYTAADSRPAVAAQYLGLQPGSLHGMSVLELGPLEGAHTYQLARLGADLVLAIEANTDAYLKCLITKEILKIPRCEFALGNFVEYLKHSTAIFDLIFCCGVLYHMEDPFELIKLMTEHTDRIFLWTHYYDLERKDLPEKQEREVIRDGQKFNFFIHEYVDVQNVDYHGGLYPSSAWLTRADIHKIFEHFGFRFEIREQNVDNANGSWITATARRWAS